MPDPDQSSAGLATPDPLARLRFVRWLVETGRLSEWHDVRYALGVARAHALARGAQLPPALAGERGAAP